MHVSGERLNQLTGIAARLRFPMPDLDLAEDHHHHHHHENDEQENDDLAPNPNRPANHFDGEHLNRAEASAW